MALRSGCERVTTPGPTVRRAGEGVFRTPTAREWVDHISGRLTPRTGGVDEVELRERWLTPHKRGCSGLSDARLLLWASAETGRRPTHSAD